MAEFLIRVTDKVNPDPYLDCRCLKRGDVVTIQEDGWAWGLLEKLNTQWRILAAPSISVLQAQGYLSPELPLDPQNPSRTLQSRGFKFDVTLLPAQWQSWVADDTRAVPIRTFNGTPQQVLAFKVQKLPIPDPNVL